MRVDDLPHRAERVAQGVQVGRAEGQPDRLRHVRRRSANGSAVETEMRSAISAAAIRSARTSSGSGSQRKYDDGWPT